MTLDEAIEIYEIRANTHEREAEYHRPLGYSHEAIATVAEWDAREERQTAKWLKELKERRAEQTEPRLEQFGVGLEYHTDSVNFGKPKGESITTNKVETEPQTDTEIAKAIVHKMIDDAVIAEDAYPDLRQKMHDAVDNYEPSRRKGADDE